MNTTIYPNRRRRWLTSLFGLSDPAYRRWLRWRKWVLVSILIILSTLFAVWLIGGNFFTLKQIVVVQQVRSQPDVMPLGSIDQKVVAWRGRWLWSDTHAMEEEIQTEFPAVSKAEVHIEFPDRLTVGVLPRVAVCQLVTPDGTFLVDRTGFVFGQIAKPAEFLPTLQIDSKPEVGKAISAAGLRLGLAFVTGLRSSSPSLTAVVIHDGRLDVSLSGPPRIIISEDRSPDLAVEQLQAMLLTFARQQKYPIEVDMRFERPVLRY